MDLGFFLLLIVLGLVAQAVFWGGLVAMVIKLVRAGGRPTGLPFSQGSWPNPGLGTGVGLNEPGPVESQVRSMAAEAGIDLDR